MAVREMMAGIKKKDLSHKLEFVGVRCHGVGRDYPATFAKLMSNGKLIEVMVVCWVQAESDKR